MEEVQKVINQTPIEIALGIGEDGMTTARKLFDFLEMNPANYARWIKRNITNNEFAEENVDYFPFVIDEECEDNKNSSARKSLTGRGNSEDYKLSSAFAKKLSMQQKNERGEQARNYFVGVEDKAKDLVLILKQASGDPMKLLKLHYAALEQVDKKVDDVSAEVQTVRSELQDLKDGMPVFLKDTKDIQNALRKKAIEALGGKDSNAYHDRSIHAYTFADIQIELRRQFGVKRYDQIRHKDVADALKIIEEYKPPLHIRDKIAMANAQQSLNLKGGATNE